jgi:hypothetical protein
MINELHFSPLPRRLKLIDIERDIQLVAAKQRLELRGAVQAGSTGECSAADA